MREAAIIRGFSRLDGPAGPHPDTLREEP